ncbi:MAG: hypothetical protein MR694_01985 [Spirochaetia bacterium]|nr:hypothetical protein [Spirochaetia bacterium]
MTELMENILQEGHEKILSGMAFLQVFVLMAVQMGRFAGGQAVADFSVPAISESFK